MKNFPAKIICSGLAILLLSLNTFVYSASSLSISAPLPSSKNNSRSSSVVTCEQVNSVSLETAKKLETNLNSRKDLLLRIVGRLNTRVQKAVEQGIPSSDYDPVKQVSLDLQIKEEIIVSQIALLIQQKRQVATSECTSQARTEARNSEFETLKNLKRLVSEDKLYRKNKFWPAMIGLGKLTNN